MIDELPPGWAEVTLNDVVSRPRSKVAPEDYPELPFVGMDHIAPDGMALLGTVPFGSMKSNGGLFLEGDVLYGRMRPYLNKVHRANTNGACSAEFIVFPKSEAINCDFLAYLLHHRKFVNFASSQSSGDRPRVDFSDLSVYEFTLPPQLEQARIVSKIDELFSRIEEGERALERVQKLVERYRQSVLKAAVTGELTRDWREKNKGKLESGEALLARILKARREAWEKAEWDKLTAKGNTPSNDNWKQKYEEPSIPKLGVAEEVPQSWTQLSLEQATKAERPIAYGVLQPGNDLSDGVLMVRVCDVADGVIETSNLKRIASAIAAEFPRTRLRGGEVLLTIVGTIGRTAIVPTELAGANVARAVGVLSPTSAVLAEWLEPCLRHEKTRQVLTKNAREVARKTLNLEQLREYAMPCPSEEEQLEAVSRMGELLSRADVAAGTIERQTRYARALRQSTLTWAFAGQLVAHAPTDEPASALLQRIATERDTATSKRRRSLKNKTQESA